VPPLNRLVRYRCWNMGFRSLPCLLALATKGPWRVWRSFRLRNSRAASARCALHSMANDVKPIFTAEHLESGWHRKSTCSPGMLLASPGVLGLLNPDPVGREGGWMADVLEEPLGSRGLHQMRSARGRSPDRASRICPFHLSGVRAAGSSDGHSDIADWGALLHRLNDRDARPFA